MNSQSIAEQISPQASQNKFGFVRRSIPNISTDSLVVADGSCPEIRVLLKHCRFPVLWLEQADQAFATISRHLALHRQLAQPVRCLHWVGHGRPGFLQIGNREITPEDLLKQQSELAGWGLQELSFWSCRYASDISVIERWEKHTGAKVFATTMPLGWLGHGLMHWSLSSADAGVQTVTPFSPVALKTWRHQLSTGAVDSAGIPANSFLSVEFEKFIVKKLASKKQKRWDYKLIVSGEEQNSIWFQDRPLRNYGHFEFDSITGKKAWDNLFQSDNPNTLLSGGGQSFLFETGPFRVRRGGGFVAKINSLEPYRDAITGDWLNASLLIDSTSDDDGEALAIGLGIAVPVVLGGILGAVLIAKYLKYRYAQTAERIAQQIEDAAQEADAAAEREALYELLKPWKEALSDFLEEPVFDTMTSASQVADLICAYLPLRELSPGENPLEEISNYVNRTFSTSSDGTNTTNYINNYIEGMQNNFEASFLSENLPTEYADSIEAAVAVTHAGLMEDYLGDSVNMSDLLDAYCSETEIDESVVFDEDLLTIYQIMMAALGRTGTPESAIAAVSNYLRSKMFRDSFQTEIMNGTDIFSVDASSDVVDSLSDALDSGVDVEDVSGLLAQSFGGDSVVQQIAGVFVDAASFL